MDTQKFANFTANASHLAFPPSDINGALLMCSLYFQIKYTLSKKLSQAFDFKVISSWEAKVHRRPSLEIGLVFFGMDMRSSSSSLLFSLKLLEISSIQYPIRLKDQMASLHRKHFVMRLNKNFPF